MILIELIFTSYGNDQMLAYSLRRQSPPLNQYKQVRVCMYRAATGYGAERSG